MRILLYPVAGYLVLVGMAALAQNSMLYFPDKTPPSSVNLRPAYGPALAVWAAKGAPEQGADYRGYVRAEAVDSPGTRGTVVVFHGNAGNARGRSYYLRALEPLGFRVILAEYPGYGGRDGKHGQASFVADGRQTARRALAEFGGPLWLWGESLGAGVAAGVAADNTLPVAGVVLITPWDNLPDLAQALYWYLPARRLVRDRYDNRADLEDYPGPVAILIAEQDEIIPPGHSQRLFEALSRPKQSWVFTGAGHNSWPTDPAAGWWDEVLDWLEGQKERTSGQPDKPETGTGRKP